MLGRGLRTAKRKVPEVLGVCDASNTWILCMPGAPSKLVSIVAVRRLALTKTVLIPVWLPSHCTTDCVVKLAPSKVMPRDAEFAGASAGEMDVKSGPAGGAKFGSGRND